MGVMTLTGFGGSGPRLAGTVSDIAAAIVSGLREDLRTIGDAQPARRDLVGRVIALEPVLDQAMGESAAVSRRRATLRAGVNGLFLALSAWRTTDLHLRSLPPAAVPALAGRLAGLLDAETAAPDAAPAARRDSYLAAAHDARQAPADTAATRLGLDRIASVFEGLGRALNGVVLLGDVRQALPLRGPLPLFVPDVLPPLVNAVRVFAAVGAATLLVIATSWSTGYSFLTFVAVTTLLLSPQNEGASKAIVGFGVGTLLSAALAAFVKFALLPNHEGYASFVLIVSVVLVPVAALATRAAFAGIFTPASMNFIPLLGPTNVISYDTASFVNAALAIIGGCLAGAVVLQVIPPVPPARRAERLLALTLADLRRTLRRPGRVTPDWWRRRIYGRVSALPSSADPADGSRPALGADRRTPDGGAAWDGRGRGASTRGSRGGRTRPVPRRRGGGPRGAWRPAGRWRRRACVGGPASRRRGGPRGGRDAALPTRGISERSCDEVRRSRPVRRLRGADRDPGGRGLCDPGRAALGGGPARLAWPRLASWPVRVCRVPDHPVHARSGRGKLGTPCLTPAIPLPPHLPAR